VKQILNRQVPLELFCILPQLLAWVLGLNVDMQCLTKLTRVVRLSRLLNYFSHRQEDLSVDVRWFAGFKFIFILFSTAHWLGCAMFYFAAESGADTTSSALSCTSW
jgi:hypothetical protein